MWSRLLILMLAVSAVLAGPAAAQSPSPDLTGSWALKMEDTAIFRFDIARSGDGWKGTWWRPKTFGIGEKGDSFYQVSGPPVEVASGAGKAVGEWAELTFPDNRPGAVPDVFRVRQLGPDRAELLYVGTGLAPFVMVRVPAGSAAGPWDSKRSYRRATVASLGLPADAAPLALPPARNATPPTPRAKPVPAAPIPPRRPTTPPATIGR